MDVLVDRSRCETVKRADLVRAIGHLVPSAAAVDGRKILNAIFEELEVAFVNGDDVKLRGFGQFIVRNKTGRVGRNPRTGEAAAIKPRKVLRFRPSPVLIAILNNEATSGEERP